MCLDYVISVCEAHPPSLPFPVFVAAAASVSSPPGPALCVFGCVRTVSLGAAGYPSAQLLWTCGMTGGRMYYE